MINLSILNISKHYWPALVLALTVSCLELPAKAQSESLISSPRIAQASDAAQNEAIKKKATQAITLLSSGNYEELRKNLSPQLAQDLTPEEIKSIWQRSQEATGAIKQQLNAKVINTINANLVVIDTQFEKMKGQFIVTFNDKQQIVGIDFPKTDSIEEISQLFVESLAASDYPKARGYLHPFLKTEVFPQQVQARWEAIIQRNGKFKKIVNTESRTGDGLGQNNLVIVTTEFENNTEPLFIIFDEERRIVGVDAPRID